MNWLWLFSFCILSSAYADSFLRLDSVHPKRMYLDPNGDGIDESIVDFAYEPMIDEWFRSESEFDPVSGTWTHPSPIVVKHDSVLGRLVVYSADPLGQPQGSCEVYELDSTQSRPIRKYLISSLGSCEIEKATDCHIYSYGSSNRVIKSEWYEAKSGVFDWSKPRMIMEYAYTSSGKILKSTSYYTGGYVATTNYLYDSSDRLLGWDDMSSGNPDLQFGTRNIYDNVTGDLTESNSYAAIQGTIAYFILTKRYGYDPVERSVTTYSFDDPKSRRPESVSTDFYDPTGYLMKTKVEYPNGVFSIYRYEY